MGNPISKELKLGIMGELLVQLRLLERGIQAAPPLRDSGNDLIGIKGETAKYIQVKTTTGNRFYLGKLPLVYHVLVLVKLDLDTEGINLDKSKIFLLKKVDVSKTSYTIKGLSRFLWEDRISKIWG